MAYFGKEFTFDREENFEEFINAIGASTESAKSFLQYKPNQIIEKNGDTYKLIFKTPVVDHEVVFKSGEPFKEVIREGLECQCTINVDGDTYTQVQDFGPLGSLTFKREYTANTLKVSVTSSKWDGVAYRYYKA
ncbi:hypothetical protein ABMA28_008845 [Loxostege sticticalis]|uniref:Uncharacterized protein n=1 Tax=Loxostege sticticalis TaxID=481309 RepID=A0ABD0SEX0_LOXSC